MFRTAYGERNRVATSFLDEEGNPLPTMTQQNFKAECEINNILRRCMIVTGKHIIHL